MATPLFGCRADDLPSVHRFAKEPTAQRATSKMGLFPQINVFGHIKSVVIVALPPYGCRVDELDFCHYFSPVQNVLVFN
ncbi:MAG: hypothetical protein V3V99_06680 [candidate division Zixibacteria bacterium]